MFKRILLSFDNNKRVLVHFSYHTDVIRSTFVIADTTIIPVIHDQVANLWNNRIVSAIVTLPKKGKGSYRLFLSTIAPKEISMNQEWCQEANLCPYAKENIDYLPLDLYAMRWNIEVSY